LERVNQRVPENKVFGKEGEHVKKSCQWQVFSWRTGAICDCGPAPTGEPNKDAICERNEQINKS